MSMAALAKASGHRVTAELSGDVDLLICVDYHPRFMTLIRRANAAGITTALVKQEPVVTAPVHRSENPGNLFKIIVTRGDPHSTPIFNTYQEWDTSEIENEHRKQRVVAINADKWSAVSGELYSLRRECYSVDDRIDLYGRGWDDSNATRALRVIKEVVIAIQFAQIPVISNLRYSLSKPLNPKGPSDSKVRTLGGYHASLAIENCPFYMSEKLVDSILAGTIPVYVGPDPSIYGIPAELVVHCQPDQRDVSNGISKALSMDGKKYRGLAQEWAGSPGVRESWEATEVANTLFRYLGNRL